MLQFLKLEEQMFYSERRKTAKNSDSVTKKENPVHYFNFEVNQFSGFKTNVFITHNDWIEKSDIHIYIFCRNLNKKLMILFCT